VRARVINIRGNVELKRSIWMEFFSNYSVVALSIFRGIAPGAAQNGRAVTHPPGIPAGVVPPPSEPPPQQQQQAPPLQVPPPSQKLSLQDPPQPLQLQSQPLQQQTQQQSGQKRQGIVDQSAETADASKQQRQQ
jgi:hypothetical protein